MHGEDTDTVELWRVCAVDGVIQSVEHWGTFDVSQDGHMYGRLGELETYAHPRDLPTGETNFYTSAADELDAFMKWQQWMEQV
jgi:hypothetical protein